MLARPYTNLKEHCKARRVITFSAADFVLGAGTVEKALANPAALIFEKVERL